MPLKSLDSSKDLLIICNLFLTTLLILTEPICQVIDYIKADMTHFDSSVIETFVTENNPKYANPRLNNSTLMDIPPTSSNLVLLPTVLVLSDISHSIARTL